MIAEIQQTATYYLKFYYNFAIDSWHGITPMGYTGLLVFIAFVGWLLMRGGKMK